MNDLTKLTHEELATELMVACHDGVCALPAKAERCRAEFLRRLTPPTGEVGELLRNFRQILSGVEYVGDPTLDDFDNITTAVSGLIAENERLKAQPTGDVGKLLDKMYDEFSGHLRSDRTRPHTRLKAWIQQIRAAVSALVRDLAEANRQVEAQIDAHIRAVDAANVRYQTAERERDENWKLFRDVTNKIADETIRRERDEARALAGELASGSDFFYVKREGEAEGYRCFFCDQDYTSEFVFSTETFKCTNPACPAVRARAAMKRWGKENE